MKPPITVVTPNTWDFLCTPMVAPTGFREYDARWEYPAQINLPGMTALGIAIGTQMLRRKVEPSIVVGNDYRDYSLAIKNALVLGLIQAGIQVKDIGVSLSPMAYFSQFHLGISAVAMVTASHNPNGWTGVKMGFSPPLTHGPEEMAELRDILLNGEGITRPGGGYAFVEGIAQAYMDDLCGNIKIKRPLKVVCATGNGTAAAFAPKILERLGVEVINLHNDLDYTFPNYNPNPESLAMLNDMAAAVKASSADFALGFDGDGDRCGVVDDEGEEIFADKIGLIMARDLSRLYPKSTFVVDVKSTGLFATDPILKASGATVDYWKTGHSHMKRRVKELNALAGFEKSGHYFLAGELGRGYDCGMRVAVELCKLMDRNPEYSMSDLRRTLPITYASPTMSPYCPDTEKYAVQERLTHQLIELKNRDANIGGRKIVGINTLNGARAILDNGSWGLIRASSNTPNLVVVCESTTSQAELRAIFDDLDKIIRTEPSVGKYDQSL